MEVYIYSLVSVFVVSLLSLIGVFTLSLKTEILQKYVFVLVSLAVGALLGDAFIHLLPQAFTNFDHTQKTSLLVIGGILLFFVLEKFLHWHHHDSNCQDPHPIGKLVLFSDSVHNFIDGIFIAASYLVSIEVGISSTIAIILHEIPQEIGDFGVLIHAGYSKARALWWNFVSALFAILGAITIFIFGNFTATLTNSVIPITAGGFVYIALSDLIPELHKTKSPPYSLLQLLSIAVGVGSMILLLGLE